MRIRVFSSASSLSCTSTSTSPPPPQQRPSSSSSPSPPSNSSTYITPSSRCEGLDLLVMAVWKVEGEGARNAGEEVGMKTEEKDNGRMVGEGDAELGSRKRRKRRQMSMPTKFRDSVLQPWKKNRKTRPPVSS